MLGDVAAAVAAFATVAAVIVALFQDRLRRRLWSPRVALTPDISRFAVKTGGRYVQHAFLRLRVEVHAGRSTAEGLQVLLLTCAPPPRLGGVEPIDRPEFLVPLRWSFTHEPSVTLPPGAARFVDLLEVGGDAPEKAVLNTEPAPAEGHILLPTGSPYLITVAVTGTNVEPARWQLKISHTGRWDRTTRGLASAVKADVKKIARPAV